MSFCLFFNIYDCFGLLGTAAALLASLTTQHNNNEWLIGLVFYSITIHYYYVAGNYQTNVIITFI